MRKVIRDSLKKASSLAEVREKLLNVLNEAKEGDKKMKVGYVAGVITSDGPDHVEENIRRLEKLTWKIRAREGGLIFSAADVFDEDLYERLKAQTLSQENWWVFWREVLESGLVTDIYMTPGWEKSKGASDEHQTATKLGISIHYEE